MAYLRKEDEKVEIDHPLEKVWLAAQKALATLQWNVEQIDETAHRIRAKTQAGFMSYSSLLFIEMMSVSENKTKMSVHAETTITTITSVANFGQTRRRMNMFFEELARQLPSQSEQKGA
jgi:hypothetical protein